MLSFVSKGQNWGEWVFTESLAIDAVKSGVITKDQKETFLQAAYQRSDAAGAYIFLYKDELSSNEREKLFNVLLEGRDHALRFMKKKVYTEEERLKFQERLESMLVVFFKYLKKFPDLLRENEKSSFYQKHKKALLQNVFRNSFNNLVEIFKTQLTIDEINAIVDQMLRLKGKRGKFLVELLNYIDANHILIAKDKKDKLLVNMTVDMLNGE